MTSYAKQTEPRRRALRGLLLRLGGYGRLNVETIVEWTEAHDGDTHLISPHVRQCDRGAVASVLSWFVDAPAAAWGPETDAARWVPTEPPAADPALAADPAGRGVLCKPS